MVPLLPLLAGLPSDRFDTLEARATDGFVAQIPLSLVRKGAEGGATAWIAVEPPDQPWPNLPGKNTGAGPFYLVWEHPERSGVTPRAVAVSTGKSDSGREPSPPLAATGR